MADDGSGKGRSVGRPPKNALGQKSLFLRKALALSGPEAVMALDDNPGHLKLMASALVNERARRSGRHNVTNGKGCSLAGSLKCADDVMKLDDDCVRLKAVLIEFTYQLAFAEERRQEAVKRQKQNAARRPSLTESLIPKLGPGRHHDNQGHGLFVHVSKNRRRRRFVQRLRIDGVDCRTDVAIGRCDLMCLEDARRKAIRNVQLAADGIHPGQKQARRSVPTVSEMINEFIAAERSNWEGPHTEREYRRLCDTHVVPALGNKRVDRISMEDLAPVVEPIWHGRGSLGYRLLQLLGRIFDRVKARQLRKDNPAKDVRPLMPKQRRHEDRHLEAVPYPKVPAAIESIRHFGRYWPDRKLFDAVSALALEMQILTACRSGEVLGSTWTEFDEENRTWTIPANRMKARRTHRVPLSDQALDVLRRVRELGTGPDDVFVYRGRNGNLRTMKNSIISGLTRRLKIPGTPHGFRSSFRDWATEIAEADFQVVELALAHVQSDRTVAAYARSDLLGRRRPLMQKWADYVIPPLREETPGAS